MVRDTFADQSSKVIFNFFKFLQIHKERIHPDSNWSEPYV